MNRFRKAICILPDSTEMMVGKMENLYKWVLLVTVALWDAMSFRVAHLSFVLQVIGKNGLAIFAKCIMGSSAHKVQRRKYLFRSTILEWGGVEAHEN